MKYESPEVTASTPAGTAIQDVRSSKTINTHEEGGYLSEVPSYSDWE
jgi:hypothetical protein